MGVVKDAKIARKCAKKLLAKLGREPTQAEIAKAVEKKKAKKGKAAPDAAAHGDATPTAAAPPPASASGAAYLAEHAVACTRDGAPAAAAVEPVVAFADAAALFGGDVAARLGAAFAAPTPVQAVAWPAACGGGDVVALAKTGSGKTLAYLLPAFRAAAAAPAGSLAVVVLAPTRELAIQIGADAAAWGGRLETVVVYGGADRRGQQRELRAKRPSCVVATPGRLKDFVDDRSLDLAAVACVVLDEADRMLDMGFEPQLAAIVDAMDGGADVERQTLFFSATWPAGVRKLASKYARGAAGPPLVVSIGGALGDGDGSGLRANAAIGQSFFKLDDSEKDEQLAKLIDGMADSDRMICFTNTKRRVDYLAKSLWADGFGASAIHGGRSQAEREEALRKFKTNEWPLMFATDVAARGLDLPDVSVVVNFDMPRDVEQYVHRIGRTGRAGKSGRSVTFWNPAYDTECAGALAKIARDAGQPVPDWLDAVAAKGKAGKNWAV